MILEDVLVKLKEIVEEAIEVIEKLTNYFKVKKQEIHRIVKKYSKVNRDENIYLEKSYHRMQHK